jgi:hypothetical protein
MKKAFLLTTVLLLLPSVVAGQLPKEGYLGLFVDDVHDRYCKVAGVGDGFLVWVWALSSENGIRAAEFTIEYPPCVTETGFMTNPLMPTYVYIGQPGTGISVAFRECHYGWVWLLRTSVFVQEESPCVIRLIPHLGNGRFGFASCVLPDYPTESAKNFTQLYVNHEPCPPGGPIAVRESTWGAIKSMYRN